MAKQAKKGRGRPKGSGGGSKKGKKKKVGGSGRGSALKNWNLIRSEVKSHLQDSGEAYTLKELNSYASELYAEHKDNIAPALQNIDLLVDGYFSAEYPDLIPSFDFWDLEYELNFVAGNAHVVVDNNGITEHTFAGTAAEFAVSYVKEFVNSVNALIRHTGEKRVSGRYLYVRFDGEYEGKDFIYYLLVREGQEGMDEKEFAAILGSKGYDLSKLVIKPQVPDLDDVVPSAEAQVAKEVDSVKVEKAKAEVIKAETAKIKAEAELVGAKEKLLARIEALYDKGLISKSEFKKQYNKLT